ncbi:hypothetical protein LY13_002387 [Prauserella aidingensis]|nr:hypothetical protein [Prauserella aidingensis]
MPGELDDDLLTTGECGRFVVSERVEYVFTETTGPANGFVRGLFELASGHVRHGEDGDFSFAVGERRSKPDCGTESLKRSANLRVLDHESERSTERPVQIPQLEVLRTARSRTIKNSVIYRTLLVRHLGRELILHSLSSLPRANRSPADAACAQTQTRPISANTVLGRVPL